MTLHRQLFITIAGLFILMFFGTLTITTIINRSYMDKQLQTHARDAATSLGLILSQESNQADLATMTSVIDAVYDRGYYQRIELADINNKPLVLRSSELKVANVPDWFIDFVHFKTPTESSLVMSGWKNFGTVTVSSHPGYAYEDLWKNTYLTLIYYFFVSIGLLLLGIAAIHGLLKPLQAITRQAIAIGEGEFPLIERIPRTLQLRQVALTMNNMVKKLERRFEEYRQVTTELRTRVYHDPITELFTQNYLLSQIQIDVTDNTAQQSVVFMQIELQGLSNYNLEHGSLMGDELLKKFALELTSWLPSNSVIGRLTGAKIAVLINPMSQADAVSLLPELAEKTNQFATENSSEQTQLAIFIGAEMAVTGMNGLELIAASDIALAIAKQENRTHYNLQQLKSGEIESEILWGDVLKFILEKKSISMKTKPALNQNYNVLFHETTFTAIGHEGQIYSDKTVRAMAKRFNQENNLDETLLNQTITLLNEHIEIISKLAMPLPTNVLQHPEQFEAFITKLTNYRFANRLILEIPEQDFVRHERKVLELFQRLNRLGTQFAFSHYGQSQSDLTYLKKLKINFLKIDPTFTHDILQQEDNQLFVTVLARMAHCIDIQVIADDVESPEERDKFVELEVDGFMGPYFDSLG